MGTQCYFCDEDRSERIEEHHIVPRRYGGSDDDDNLVNLCSNCHRAIEALYDDRFYQQLGVKKPEGDGDTTSIEFQNLMSPMDLKNGEMYFRYWDENVHQLLIYKRRESPNSINEDGSYIFIDAYDGEREKLGQKTTQKGINHLSLVKVNLPEGIRPQEIIIEDEGRGHNRIHQDYLEEFKRFVKSINQ